MSKTTIFLVIILLLFVGCLFYSMSLKTQNPISKSFAKPLPTRTPQSNTTLSFSNQSVKPGQTTTVNVIINSTGSHPNLAQLEIAYDPTVMTIDSVTPGTFFLKPTVVLENIDPVAGRISFALRCSNTQNTNTPNDCINTNSDKVATITLSINAYTLQNSTTLSFQPKTVVRTFEGRDLLKKTTDLQLPITHFLSPVSSSSGFINPIIHQPVSSATAH